MSATKSYKARFVRATSFAATYKQSHCVMPISVGQEYHRDEKFKAILELVNNNFASCTIVVADSLQRHTLQVINDYDESTALQTSKILGEKWLNSHKIFFENLFIFSVRKWEEWLNDESCKNRINEISENYLNNDLFRNAFNSTCEMFLVKYRKRYNFNDIKAAQSRHLILRYLIEECAIMSCWVNEGFHFETYPSSRSPAMQVTYDTFVKPHYPNLLKYLEIDLKSRNNSAIFVSSALEV